MGMLDALAGALRVDDPNATGFKGVLQNAQGMFSDDVAKYQEGGINAAEVGLRGLGEAGRTIGDTVGLALEPAMAAVWNNMRPTTREFLAKGATELAQGVMNTDSAKAAAAYLKENPRMARNLGSAINMMDLVPGVRAVAKGSGGDVLNRLAHNYRTHNEGWYSGIPTEKAKGIFKNAGDALQETAAELISPTLRAQHREFGTGRGRRKEFFDAKKLRTEYGNQYASCLLYTSPSPRDRS